MILISQAPTKHSRIGNSIYWMIHAQFFFKKIEQKVIFPWALEKFQNYLNDDSFWLHKDIEIEEFFLKKFEKNLNAENLSKVTRMLEYEFELKNNLEPFEYLRSR